MSSNKFHYKTSDICATEVSFEVRNGKVYDVVFTKGCRLKSDAIAEMVEGMSVENTILRFKRGLCEHRKTSCGDQLAKALVAFLEQHKEK